MIKEEIMNKKEKIIAGLFILSVFLMISSCIFTLYLNKSKGEMFYFEQKIQKLISQMNFVK